MPYNSLQESYLADFEEGKMVKGIAKAIAYRKMPRGAFALMHPMRATKIGLAMWVGRQLLGRKRK